MNNLSESCHTGGDMKIKSLKSLVKKVRSNLDWPVLEESSELPAIRIVSYPRTKSHVILTPPPQQHRSSDLDYLHELGHATLCEQVHPVFSASSQFAAPDNKRQFLAVIPALNAACDWFVNHWQWELAPLELQKQIGEGLPVAEEVLGAAALPPLEIILDASLLIAQGIHYLDEPIECSGVLKVAVDAFLSFRPEKPSSENCVLLVNRLMATYTDHRVRLLLDDGFYTWEVYQPASKIGDNDNDAQGAAI
jgi:hypothetical protein